MIKQDTMFSDTTDEVNSLRPNETDLEKLRRIEKSIFTEMAAAERARMEAMKIYCQMGDEESKVMYAYFDGAFHTIWNLIKKNHLEVEYHEFVRQRRRAEKE